MRNWLWILVSLSFSYFVILGLKRNSFKFRFAVIWMFLSLGLVFIAAFPSLVSTIASGLGLTLVSNFVFAIAIFTLGLINLILTIENNNIQKRLIDLAIAFALIEYRIRNIETVESGQESSNEKK